MWPRDEGGSGRDGGDATEGWGGSEIALSREKEREREVFIRTVEPLSL